MGKWNGFGGKLEPGETIDEAAMREIREEVGVMPVDILRVGVLDFSWQGKPEVLEVHVFKAVDFEGEPMESEEMKPQWFHIDEIPFDKMWQDDKYWLPFFLKDKKFKGRFIFDDNNSVVSHELVEARSV